MVVIRVFLAVALVIISTSCACVGEEAVVNEIPNDTQATEFDKQMIALTYELARTATRNGNPPFGAILVHGDSIVAEATNTSASSGDVTRHAETGLISDASRRFGRKYLSDCSLYPNFAIFLLSSHC